MRETLPFKLYIYGRLPMRARISVISALRSMAKVEGKRVGWIGALKVLIFGRTGKLRPEDTCVSMRGPHWVPVVGVCRAPVWRIVQVVRAREGVGVNELLNSFPGLSTHAIDTALEYAEQHRDEIELAIKASNVNTLPVR